MTAEIRLRLQAKQDLAEAAKWYNEQWPGLGEAFLNEARATFSTMAEMPSIYPVVHRSTRRAVMHRFPFSIFYRVDDLGIVVLAVLHGSRHPRTWMRRL